MTLGENIRHGTKWLMTGSVGGQALQFLIGIVLARLLVPSEFGLLITVQIFTGFVGMIASAGMGEALVQAKETTEKDFRVVFTLQLALGIAIFGAFYLIAPAFAAWFGNPVYESILRVSAISFLLRPFSTNPSIRLRRAMRFKEIALTSFIAVIVSGIASIVLALDGRGVWSLILGGLLGTLVSIVLLSLRAPWRPMFCFSHRSAHALGSYGSKNVVNEILVYFRAQTSNFIIAKLAGAGPVGLYNKADSLGAMPVRMIGGSTYQTVFRALSKVQDDLNQSRYIYLRTVALVSLYTLPIYITLAWVTEPLIVGMFGSPWRDAAAPLTILCIAAPFRCLEFASGAVVAARKRLGEEIILQLQALVLIVCGVAIGINYGLNGVACASIAASAYLGVRLTSLALNAVQCKWLDILRALAPVVKLCAIETVILLVTHLFLSQWQTEMHPLLYTAVMCAAGLAGYCLPLLSWPPKSLMNEANRWRRTLGLKEFVVPPSS